MVHLGIQYFSLNRILLLLIGLWPYHQSKFTRFQFIFFSTILILGIIFQFTTLMTSKCTSNLSKVLSSTSYFIFCMIIYGSFRVNIKVIKDVLMQFENILNQVKDKNEAAIIKEYNYIARRDTIILTTFAVISGSICTIGQYLSNLIVLSKNISRLPITIEYFIDQEKYFYLILLHAYVIICIGGVVLLALATMSFTCGHYICGMFRIASYRIEHAININIRQNITLKNEILMREDIICAVDIHRQAMKLCKLLVSVFEVMVFCLIIFGMTCLVLNLFQIFQSALSENTVGEFCLPLLYVLVMIASVFVANYGPQNITDHNNYVLSTVYNVQWYKAPLHIQKMILFLLQRKAKEFTLTTGGLFTGSMECFATLVKTSISYFTVIYSMS